MYILKNKVVVITGSSIGIGRETAYKFAKEGCKVVITYYKDKNEAFEVLNRCMKLGASDALVIKLNATNDNEIKDFVKEIVRKYSGIDILINNAGIVVWKYLEKQSYKEIEDQLRTNLEGLIKITKTCLPYIKDTIINIASAAGLEGYEDLTTYCATKFGVRGFTQALAKELKNVKTFVVNPGTIATRMNNFHGLPPEKVAEAILNIAKGKYKAGSGSDINVW